MIKEKIKKTHKAQVKINEKVSNNSYYIEFESQEPFFSKAGQYVSILCNNLTLRRPFSIAYQNGNRIGVLFKEKGEGTNYIKNLNVGEMIDFIGPLGNGFNIGEQKSLLVGAGIGIAPVFYLQNKLKEMNIDNLLLGGFLSENEIPRSIICDKVVTNDGSLGKKGSVLDYIEQNIQEFNPQVIYACGPSIVLKKISELAQKYSIESQIAMEKVMACGIGVCRGCVIKINRGSTIENATICKDGPVFKGREVIWEE